VSEMYSCLVVQPAELGTMAPMPAALFVQDRPEQTRGVEARTAVPIYRAVRAHKRDRMQVADQAMLGNRQVIVCTRNLVARHSD
jgi:hypothetical protein